MTDAAGWKPPRRETPGLTPQLASSALGAAVPSRSVRQFELDSPRCLPIHS